MGTARPAPAQAPSGVARSSPQGTQHQLTIKGQADAFRAAAPLALQTEHGRALRRTGRPSPGMEQACACHPCWAITPGQLLLGHKGTAHPGAGSGPGDVGVGLGWLLGPWLGGVRTGSGGPARGWRSKDENVS